MDGLCRQRATEVVYDLDELDGLEDAGDQRAVFRGPSISFSLAGLQLLRVVVGGARRRFLGRAALRVLVGGCVFGGVVGGVVGWG